MKIIIPMAGRGSRLRPHTLTVPKPLVPIAGKPIVHRLVEDIVEVFQGSVEEIAFIIGDFGQEVETQLLKIASDLGAKGTIYHQDEPLGTAHAIWMAEQSMDDEIIIAFADTLFRADFKLDRSHDGVIWVKAVEDPSAFGVVTVDEKGVIDELVEKPQEFVSDLAIIGIYYVKDGPALRAEIKHIIDNDLKEKGEYQLTNALENLKNKGAAFVPGKVNDWMDCGNKDAVLDTTQKILGYDSTANKPLIAEDLVQENSVIIPPCQIGTGVTLKNAIIGPNVTIGNNTEITDSVIQTSIIGFSSKVAGATFRNSIVGNYASVEAALSIIDIGDYSSTQIK